MTWPFFRLVLASGVWIALLVGLGGLPEAAADVVPAGAVAIPEPTPEAIRFHQTGLVFWFVARAWSFAVPALLLVTGWSGRIGRFASGRNRPRVVAVAIYAALFLTYEFALKLPLRYYLGFVRLHDYGLSTQTWPRWLGDSVKTLGVEIVGAGLFAWVPFWLMSRSPRRWWLSTGLLILPFSAFSATVAPILVDPLFNQFGPMKDPAIEARILALAERAGIQGSRIYEVDKSQDTTTVNAYVTGLFGTKRIVLWDTIIQKLDADELLVVMGHEMGHYVLNHVAIGISLAALGTLAGLFVVDRAARRLIARFSGRFGFTRIDDVASIPLLLILIQAMVLVTGPVSNAASRWMEHEADRFALELTRDNLSAANGFAKLQRDNLAIPFPDLFTRVWRSSHPAIGERPTFHNPSPPRATGPPLRYADRFAAPSPSGIGNPAGMAPGLPAKGDHP